jgi:hypothetical protein
VRDWLVREMHPRVRLVPDPGGAASDEMQRDGILYTRIVPFATISSGRRRCGTITWANCERKRPISAGNAVPIATRDQWRIRLTS